MDTSNSNADNPYAPPTSDVMLASQTTEGSTAAEKLRRKYLKHEATIRSLGTLQFLGAAFLLVAAVAILFSEALPQRTWFSLAAAGILLAAAVGLCFVGRGLHRLQPWARIVAVVLLVLNFPAAFFAQRFNPIALGFVAVLLFWLLNEKGRMVFSPEYRQAVAETPHIKYYTSRWVWIALAVIVAVVVIGVVLALGGH